MGTSFTTDENEIQNQWQEPLQGRTPMNARQICCGSGDMDTVYHKMEVNKRSYNAHKRTEEDLLEE